MRKRRTLVGTWTIAATLAATSISLAAPKTIINTDLKYSIAIPSECRLEEGPGTLEAICAADLDEAKAAELPKATAFLLEIDAEAVPSDAKPYAEAEFRQEVPEAVCGESDATRVKITNVKIDKTDAASVITADATCPEIKFLGLEERHARVSYVIAPKYRYRLMTRTPASDAAKTKTAADNFFASFKQTAE
ncbi:MAG: hypothetical protein ABL898_03130 [Hyphomicrobiaceae bacterium]|nr:hypothetical protein [Hyphomicrobiaceae bacterium]